LNQEKRPKALLGVDRPQEIRPQRQPVEKHGVLVDVVLPVAPATAIAIGAVAQQVGGKKKDK